MTVAVCLLAPLWIAIGVTAGVLTENFIKGVALCIGGYLASALVMMIYVYYKS